MINSSPILMLPYALKIQRQKEYAHQQVIPSIMKSSLELTKRVLQDLLIGTLLFQTKDYSLLSQCLQSDGYIQMEFPLLRHLELKRKNIEQKSTKGNKKPQYLCEITKMEMTKKEDCPCRKKKCIRHGNCILCREHHAGSKRKRPCERNSKTIGIDQKQ